MFCKCTKLTHFILLGNIKILNENINQQKFVIHVPKDYYSEKTSNNTYEIIYCIEKLENIHRIKPLFDTVNQTLIISGEGEIKLTDKDTVYPWTKIKDEIIK